MRSRSRALLAAFVGVLFIILIAVPALGAETSNSEFVIIQEGDVLEDDLYAGAIRVVVEGTIDGDLIAFAGEEVVIAGKVTGSVFALTPTLTIDGEIGGSVRMSGSTLEIEGHVARDVVAGVFSARLSESSIVDGDVLVWAWNAGALGTIGEDLTGSMRNLDISGEIQGDVDVSVGRLEVVDALQVVGDLGYRSESVATGLELTEVDGTVVHKTPLAPNLRVRALGLFGRFMVILLLTVAGLAVAYQWPVRTEKAMREVASRPLKSWARGALVFASPLLAVLVTGLIFNLAPAAAAFPLLAILAPIVLALFGIVFALALVAGIPTVAWVGSAILKRFDLYGAIVVGALMTGLVWYLPILGVLVPLVVLPLGLGAWLLSRTQTETATGF